jgi:molybdopterin-guanine dinucleotide biosynthesis protein A
MVLAGGRGLRMGGADKGLVPYKGQTLVGLALQRLRDQVDVLAVNANRNLPDYTSFGVPVWPDPDSDFAGPLAGFLTGLRHCKTPYLLTVPCDSPNFPLDLAPRLLQAMQNQQTSVAMAHSGDSRAEPVFCLMRIELRPNLTGFLEQGGRKVMQWVQSLSCATVTFDAPHDDPLAFANVNTPQELTNLAGPNGST